MSGRKAFPIRLFLGISLIGLVVILTRLAEINAHSLWYDEGFFLFYNSTPGFPGFFRNLTHTDASDALQPLYVLALWGWVHLAGLSELTLRTLSAIFGIIFVAASWWALGGSRPRGSAQLVASVLAAGSAFSIYYSQEARPYALLQLLSMVSLGVWLRLREPIGRSSAFMLAGVAVLCSLGGIFSILYLVALSLADLIADWSLKSWLRRWWASICASLAIALFYGALLRLSTLMGGSISRRHQPLWTNLAYSFYGLLFGPTMPPPQNELRGVDKYAVAFSYWPVLLCAAAVIACLVTGIAAGATDTREKRRSVIRRLTLVVFLYSGLLVVFVALTSLNFQPRHAAMLLAPVILLMAYCAAERAGRSAFLIWTGIAGWLVLNAFAFYNYRFDPAYRKDDYRQVASIITSRGGSRDHEAALLLWGSPDLLRFYGVSGLIDARQVEPRDLGGFMASARIAGKMGVADRVTLIVNRPFYWFDGADPALAIADRYSCNRSELPYFALYECSLRN